LSTLYPAYIGARDVYRCPADMNPDDTPADQWKARLDNKYSEAYDRPGNTGKAGYMDPNYDVTKISYFYEFTHADCSWSWKGTTGTWGEVKKEQLKDFETSLFPIVRGWWHLDTLRKSSVIGDNSVPVMNISYDGNFFLSKPEWELGVWLP
jgi:hypothetical protein